MGELTSASRWRRSALAALLLALGLAAPELALAAGGASARVDTADEGDESTEDLPDDPNAPVPTSAQLRARYELRAVDPAPLTRFKAPAYPDLSAFTRAGATAQVASAPRGRVSVDSLLVESGFKPLTSASGSGLGEFARRQRGSLRAIFIEGGTVSLPQLASALPREQFESLGGGRYIARLPLLVRHGATLVIGAEVKELRLSQDRGALIANEGTLLVSRSRIVGWNEAAGAVAKFSSPDEFRPYLVAWSGSRSLIVESTLAHLGYRSPKAFGLTVSTYTLSVNEGEVWPRPTAWLIDSTIEDLWYGFYSREAEQLVLKGNRFRDNQLYGVNIHDGSSRTVVADNEISGTRGKHGLILSREVSDSWILRNKSHDNGLSGIVLDRQCHNNVIAGNLSYKNRASGFVLSESPNNLVYDNVASGNLSHGVRLRNATGIRIQDTSAIANGLAGISAVSRDLSGTGRDTKLDPYTRAVAMTVVGGQVSANGSGPINIEEPTRIELYGIDLRTPQRSLGYRLGGAMLAFQIEVLDIVLNQKQAALLVPRKSP